MAGPLPVKGTEISSAPCSVRKAASLLRRFLSSEAALEVGIARGYVEAVAQSLEEILARGKDRGTEGLRLTTAGRSSKFFNIGQAPKTPEIKKKSRKEKESKQKKKDQAMVDFEALLGHELDGAGIGKQADGELGSEEKTEMLPSTPRQVDSVDDGRESQKSEKKKKKRKSLGGAAMDVDMDETQSSRKADDSDPDNTKSAKKKKKRKSLDGVISNGLFSSPAKEVKAEARAEDEDMKPADDVMKKKKKKHRGDTSQGATPMKEESKKVLTEHMNSSIGDRGSNMNDSGMQQQGSSVKKKSKKRSSEMSPGNFDDQHRKSKKLRLSD